MSQIDHDEAERPRDGHGRYLPTLENIHRDAEALAMRTRGSTYQQIADALDYSDRHTARRAVETVLKSIPAAAVDELRAIEGERLDCLMQEAFGILGRDHLTVSQGGKIVKDDDGNLILDDGPKLAAINTLVRISERRSKLFGLDAPTLLKVDALQAARDAEAEQEAALLRRIEETRVRLRAEGALRDANGA